MVCGIFAQFKRQIDCSKRSQNYADSVLGLTCGVVACDSGFLAGEVFGSLGTSGDFNSGDVWEIGFDCRDVAVCLGDSDLSGTVNFCEVDC